MKKKPQGLYRPGVVLALAACLLVGCGAARPATAAPPPVPTATMAPQPTLCPAPTGFLAQNGAQNGTQLAKATAETAPQPPAEAYAGVKLAAYVTPEMLLPGYWATPADDELVMDAPAIEGYNRAVVAALSPEGRMLDLYAMGETLPGEKIRAMLAADPSLNSKDFINGAPQPAGYGAALAENANAAALPATVALQFGVTVERVNVRVQPTADFAAATPGEAVFDHLQQAELYWNEPVVILHESRDGGWYYIAADRMDGWVPKTSVARFDTRADWLAWQSPADFLVVTANRLRLDYNTETPALSERELAMGTVLPLADPATLPEKVAGRVAYGNYIVRLPLRGADGRVTAGFAPVAVSAETSRGWLPYTRRALLGQLFKMQGMNYGWGGGQSANDCSGITLQVYRCFGLRLARNSKSLNMLPGRHLDFSGLSAAGRAEALAGLPAGTILYMPGHIMLYLGTRAGRFYVMSATGTLTMPGAGTQTVLTTLLTDLSVERKPGVTWLDSLAGATVVE